MNEANTNKDLLIERYLLGRMTEEDAASFEEQFLASGELLDELETAERLQQGLQTVAAVEKARGKVDQRGARVASSGITALFHSPRYAMAASFLLLVSLGVSSHLARQNNQLSSMGPGNAVPVAEIFELVTVRGVTDEMVNTLELGEGITPFMLMIDPGFEPYSRHRATVYRLPEGGSPEFVWQVDGLKPGIEEGYEDMLALNLPGSVLEEGDYEVHIEGHMGDGTDGGTFEMVDSYRFRCVSK